MNDDAVREVIENIFGTMSGNSIDYAAAITADLRASGHLRTPGTVEVSREALTLARTAVGLASDHHARDQAAKYKLDAAYEELDAAIAAGADDGE